MTDSVRELTVPVRVPYRLDLTITVLRRLSTNIVDVFDGRVYRRLLDGPVGSVLIEVTQPAPDALSVCFTGEPGPDLASVVRRMLGADVDLTFFYEASSSIPWLAALIAGARGVKPPRYPSLWEAIVNAVVFQQVSIHAAAAILRRVIELTEPPRTYGGAVLAAFPGPGRIVAAAATELRAAGLSVNKVVALRTLGRALIDGELDPAALDPLDTAELIARLVTFKGIGPWTAAVIALRGFGRLDSFPLKDSGVARTLKDLSGDPDVDAASILTQLGPQRGMLYYHLLLGRLAARGEISLAV